MEVERENGIFFAAFGAPSWTLPISLFGALHDIESSWKKRGDEKREKKNSVK
jgi:hypothetical protein